jgi:hypothetical protein
MALSGADIYKVKVSVAAKGPDSREMRVVSAALDTAAGAVLVDKKSLPKAAVITASKKLPRVVDASGKKMKIIGTTHLELRIDSIVLPLEAWVVSSLPVQLILGTHFLDLHVDSILPREKVVWIRDPVSKARCEVAMQRQSPSEDAATKAANVKAASDFCIPPYTEMAARVRSCGKGHSEGRRSLHTLFRGDETVGQRIAEHSLGRR